MPALPVGGDAMKPLKPPGITLNGHRIDQMMDDEVSKYEGIYQEQLFMAASRWVEATKEVDAVATNIKQIVEILAQLRARTEEL